MKVCGAKDANLAHRGVGFLILAGLPSGTLSNPRRMETDERRPSLGGKH
jgi:hypothetical protein